MAATDAKTGSKAFPMERFKQLLEKSEGAKLFAQIQKDEIQKAMDQGDVALLEKVYQMLLQEQSTEKEIASDFAAEEKKIVDQFMVAATDVRKKITEAPMKEKIAQAEKQEEDRAEAMLKKI